MVRAADTQPFILTVGSRFFVDLLSLICAGFNISWTISKLDKYGEQTHVFFQKTICEDAYLLNRTSRGSTLTSGSSQLNRFESSGNLCIGNESHNFYMTIIT